MKQGALFSSADSNRNKIGIGSGLFLEIIGGERGTVFLYRSGNFVKKADLSDRVARSLFVVETIDLGAIRSLLAQALSISRQTIHNYLEIRKRYGLEGLIHGYIPAGSKNLLAQRRQHKKKGSTGNKARLLEDIRLEEREQKKQKQLLLNFSFGSEEVQTLENAQQPFSQEHNWEVSRYAGVFAYLLPLITEWKWLSLVIGRFGKAYKIFMVFLLMAARNIRSIEQLKNVRVREAGIILGLGRLPAKKKIWEWFYSAASQKVSQCLLRDYFRCQLQAGLVGLWLWFVDGHLLPYTGKESVRHSYNTQRRMPYPGQTSMVTCDQSGRVVDFEIQEGKGDLRSHIAALGRKWDDELSQRPMMVFDREGYGADFFWGLIQDKIPFVTWEKHADRKKLAALDEGKFEEEFEFNHKRYRVFEGEKSFTCQSEDPEKQEHRFSLRRIYLWNLSSNRRACGLAYDNGRKISTADCARAILSRWGASENTFKHMNDRHPGHYHPGFKLVESDRQEITNPAVKEKEGLINRLKKELVKLYKKLAKSEEKLNKDGQPRQNSRKKKLKCSVQKRETELETIKQEKSKLADKVDVSTLENYRSFKRIDNEGKYLFDFVTSSVWNARKQMVDWLRPYFSQENELVDLFYTITNCHGWIKNTKTEVVVRLEALQQPKRRMAQEQLCRKLTGLRAQTPTGKWLVMEVGESPL